MRLGRDAAYLAVPRRRGGTVAVRIEHESRITWMAWMDTMAHGMQVWTSQATCGVLRCCRTWIWVSLVRGN